MSWLDRVQNRITITTGEGSVWQPKWRNATKVREYNVTEFNFPEVSGTFVKRQQPKGRKYLLEFYFEGANTIEDSTAFELAADDPRPWIVSHPYYDRIVVQPLSLNIDNTKYNSTQIKANVIETIEDSNPKTSVNSVDKIVFDHAEVNTAFEQSYDNNVTPEIDEINDLTENNEALFLEGEKIASDTPDFEGYFNAFNTANTAISNAITAPLMAIRTLQAVINAPALFKRSVKARIDTFLRQLNRLVTSISGVVENSEKRLFENNAGVLMSAFCLALVSGAVYSNRREVFGFVELLVDNYNRYLVQIDQIQSDDNSSPDSYIPDFDSQNRLNDLVNFTIANLFEVAINSRQERSIILEEDSNIINVTHRFYGLDLADENMNELIETNSIGLDEYLILKKGREIIYFV